MFAYRLWISPYFLQISNGPLAIAVIAWKNSLVFHDIDKITSLYIHIAPPLGTFKLRDAEPQQSFMSPTMLYLL